MRTKSEKLYDEADGLAWRIASLAKDLDPYEFYDSATESDPGDALTSLAVETRMALLSGRKHEVTAFFAGFEPDEVAEGYGKDTAKELKAVLKALERFRRRPKHD